MIIKAEIISRPYSGEYPEKIYDYHSSWNSQNWTFIKFTNDDFSEWCGQFRGGSGQVAISNPGNTILVLTSDYLYLLDIEKGDVIELKHQSGYRSLTVAPDGDFIVASYYNLERLSTSVMQISPIDSPVQMDMIKFKTWDNSRLEFTCNEFLNWNREITMIYDSSTNTIEEQDIKSNTLTKEELEVMIKNLEESASEEKASFGMYYRDEEDMHIAANKDGFELFAAELLKASRDSNSIIEKATQNYIPFGWKSWYEGESISYIKPIPEDRGQLQDDDTFPETFKDRIIKYMIIAVLGIICLSIIVGIFTIVTWFI